MLTIIVGYDICCVFLEKLYLKSFESLDAHCKIRIRAWSESYRDYSVPVMKMLSALIWWLELPVSSLISLKAIRCGWEKCVLGRLLSWVWRLCAWRRTPHWAAHASTSAAFHPRQVLNSPFLPLSQRLIAICTGTYLGKIPRLSIAIR